MAVKKHRQQWMYNLHSPQYTPPPPRHKKDKHEFKYVFNLPNVF